MIPPCPLCHDSAAIRFTAEGETLPCSTNHPDARPCLHCRKGLHECSTCEDTGRVREVFDAGSCFAPCYDPDGGKPCPDCRKCDECGERHEEGDFARPFPECDAVCSRCCARLRADSDLHDKRIADLAAIVNQALTVGPTTTESRVA